VERGFRVAGGDLNRHATACTGLHLACSLDEPAASRLTALLRMLADLPHLRILILF
jgi:hypothetical protein